MSWFTHVNRFVGHTFALASSVNSVFDQVANSFANLPAPRSDGKGFSLPLKVADGYESDDCTTVAQAQYDKLVTGSDSGTANAYAVAINANVTSYVDGMRVKFKPAHANTGASTVNVNSLGGVNLKHADGTDLVPGDLATDTYAHFVFNGTEFRAINLMAGDAIAINTSKAEAANSADDSKQWAIGVPSEPVGNSSKYWAQIAMANVPPSMIQTPMTLYLSPSGSDTTGDGTSGNPWKSINRAMGYLQNKMITADVTIIMAAGNYNLSEPQIVSHPDANKISIVGAGTGYFSDPTTSLNYQTSDAILLIDSCIGLSLSQFKTANFGTTQGTGILINNSIVMLDGDIAAQSGFTGIQCERSKVSISGNFTVVIDNVQYGLYLLKTNMQLHDFTFTNGSSIGDGINSLAGSSLLINGNTHISNWHDYAIIANYDSSVVMLGGVTLSDGNGTGHDLSPSGTIGANTAPNFGNYGSFIIKAS